MAVFLMVELCDHSGNDHSKRFISLIQKTLEV